MELPVAIPSDLALFCDDIHGFTSRFVGEEGVCSIPKPVVDEVLSVTLLSNHLRSDFRAEVPPTIGATHASADGLGATEARVANKVLFQRAELKKREQSWGGNW